MTLSATLARIRHLHGVKPLASGFALLLSSWLLRSFEIDLISGRPAITLWLHLACAIGSVLTGLGIGQLLRAAAPRLGGYALCAAFLQWLADDQFLNYALILVAASLFAARLLCGAQRETTTTEGP